MKRVPKSGKSQKPTRRCHWVPQAYLRAWAVAPGNTPRVWRLSKLNGDPELKRVDKIAVKHHLYIPKDDAGIRDDSLERKLSELERFYRDPVWHALQSGMVDISSDPIRKLISLLAATMFLRTPEQLQKHKEIHASLVEAGKRGDIQIDDVTDWEQFRDADEDGIKKMWIKEINRAGHYANMLKSMRWSVLMSDIPVFVTTDNPITFIHQSLRFRGIKDPETMILFPLSPTRLLTMDHRYNEPSNQYYTLKQTEGFTNLLLWRGATEFMFSHKHSDEICRSIDEAGTIIDRDGWDRSIQ